MYKSKSIIGINTTRFSKIIKHPSSLFNQRIFLIKLNSFYYNLLNDFHYFINKFNKYISNYTHINSAQSILPIYFNLFYENKLKNIFLGKPFGFQAFLFMIHYYFEINDSNMELILSSLNENNFTGVITEKILSKVINDLEKNYNEEIKEIVKIFKEIKYIDSTLGSVLSVAQGFSYNSDIKDIENINVIIPDSLFLMGEFLENLMLSRYFDFKNITLWIDFNYSTKLNDIKIASEEIQLLLKNFNYNLFITKFLKEFNYEK